MSGRQNRKQLVENRRVDERKAVERFLVTSNEAHTRLTEKVYATEASNISFQTNNVQDTDRNREYLAEINRIAAFINRYLGHLRGQGMLLELSTTNPELLAALADLYRAISEAYRQITEINDRHKEFGEAHTKKLSILNSKYSALIVQPDLSPQLDKLQLDEEYEALSGQLRESFIEWRSAMLNAALNFRVQEVVGHVVHAGKVATDAP